MVKKGTGRTGLPLRGAGAELGGRSLWQAEQRAAQAGMGRGGGLDISVGGWPLAWGCWGLRLPFRLGQLVLV